MEKTSLAQRDFDKGLIVRQRSEHCFAVRQIVHGRRRCGAQRNKRNSLRFITIVDGHAVTVGHQVARKISTHVTKTNDADPLDGRLGARRISMFV